MGKMVNKYTRHETTIEIVLKYDMAGAVAHTHTHTTLHCATAHTHTHTHKRARIAHFNYINGTLYISIRCVRLMPIHRIKPP